MGQGQQGWRRWGPAWVGLLGAVLFAPTLQFGLVGRDDPWLIRDNVLLREFSVAGLRSVFFDFSWGQRFRLGAEYLPIRDVSVMFDHAVFGSWYGGHHLTQVVLYGVACALAVTLVQLWTRRWTLAWVTGVLFALHPLHVEAVAWLSERKGVLGAVFLFASLCALQRFVDRGGLRWWLLTTVSFVMAVFSKAHMVAGLGAAVLLLSAFVDGAVVRRRAVGILSFLAIGAAAFAPGWATGQLIGMVQASHAEGFVANLGLFAQIHALYLKLTAYVGPYAIHYPVVGAPNASLARLVGGAGLLLMLGMMGAATVDKERRGPLVVGVGWWLVFLAPVSHLVFPLQNLAADRYMLVPSLGAALVAATFLTKLPRRPMLVALLALGLVSGGIASAQVRTWASSDAMWQQALVADDGNGVAWEKRAAIAATGGDLDQAWRYTEQGLAHEPDSWRLHHRQALILRKRGEHAQALIKFRTAASDPNADKAHANLALTLLRTGDLVDARRWAERAVSVRENVSHNQRVLGQVAVAQKDWTTACKAFGKALWLDPYDADNKHNERLCTKRREKRTKARPQ